MGFGKRGKNSFTVHRSEEVLPGEVRGGLSRGSSASSDGEGSADGDRFALRFLFFRSLFIFISDSPLFSFCSVLHFLVSQPSTVYTSNRV